MTLFRWAVGAALAMTALVSAMPATAQTAGEESSASPPVVTNPDWLRKPTGDDLARYYPDRAQRDGVSGAATISCSVDAAGRLERCAVVSETPADYGFGEAALKLSRTFEMQPKTSDGTAVAGGVVRIPIVFRVPEGGSSPTEDDLVRAGVPALLAFLALLIGVLAYDARRRDPSLSMRRLIGDSLAAVGRHWRAAPAPVLLLIVFGVLCRHPAVANEWRLSNAATSFTGLFVMASGLRLAFADYGRRFAIKPGGFQFGEAEGKVWIANLASSGILVLVVVVALVLLGGGFALLKVGGVDERLLLAAGGAALGLCLAVLLVIALRLALAPAMSVAAGELDIRGSWAASQGRLGALIIISVLGIANLMIAEILASLLPGPLWAIGGLIVGLADAIYYSSYTAALAGLTLMIKPPRRPEEFPGAQAKAFVEA